ncbi:MAG: hypothetical protein KDA21_13760 [Phycisphaerales bacterium]|nr:hypothetical protein [Phycisphaerales bacterium]
MLVQCVLASVLMAAPRGGGFGDNLVTNPDAEAGVTGWTANTGVDVVGTAVSGTNGVDDPAVLGELVFNGGLAVTDVEMMSQVIDLSGFAAAIDAGNVTARVDALLQSRIPSAQAADRAELHVSFQNASGGALTNTLLVDTHTPVNVYDWTADFDELPLPAGVRQVTLTQRYTKNGGASIDSYIDNISLVLTVPCPGDVNGDGSTDFTDLNVLLEHWGDSGATMADGDLTGEGDVNFTDLNLLLQDWGCGN